MSLLKKNLITNYFKKVEKNTNIEMKSIKIDSSYHSYNYGYNKDTGNWHCLECGENMGNNSRQLCGKSMCLNSHDNIV